MPRNPSKFTQADVSKVLKAMSKAGLRARVDIMPDGRISIFPSNSEVADAENPWEQAIAKIAGED